MYFSIEIRAYLHFLCGFFLHEFKDIRTNIKEYFKNKGLKLGDSNDWLCLLFKTYDFKDNKIAHNVYDDQWNNLYAEHMEEITQMFFENVEKMFETWKDFIKSEENSQNTSQG